jgi:hypothetical protein
MAKCWTKRGCLHGLPAPAWPCLAIERHLANSILRIPTPMFSFQQSGGDADIPRPAWRSRGARIVPIGQPSSLLCEVKGPAAPAGNGKASPGVSAVCFLCGRWGLLVASGGAPRAGWCQWLTPRNEKPMPLGESRRPSTAPKSCLAWGAATLSGAAWLDAVQTNRIARAQSWTPEGTACLLPIRRERRAHGGAEASASVLARSASCWELNPSPIVQR